MQKSSQRWLDIPAITFLVMAVLITSTRLSLTKWTPDLQTVGTLTTMGLLLGFSLGYSRFKKWGIGILTLGYSITIIPWQITRVLGPVLTTQERIYEMSARVSTGLTTFIAKEPVEDHLLVLILLGLIFWSVAIYSSYSLIRFQNSLAAILPSATAILFIQYNDHNSDSLLWILGFYFFFALILFGRLDYLKNRTRWQEKNVFIVPDAKFDINLLSIISIAMLLLVAWNIPSSSAEWREISRWWDKTAHRFRTTTENIENLFSSIDNPRPASGGVFYGSSLSLGERSYQGTEEIVVVQVQENIENPPPRYYWRVRSYDTYLNGGWTSADSAITSSLPAQTPLLIPIDPESQTAKFTFTNKSIARPLLITGHQTYWTDIDAEAVYTELPDDTLDLNLLRATPAIKNDESYSTRAAPLAPTVSQLRAAGTDYPEWVTERYLQLPEDLPPAISELARELTRGRATPYDKARVITTYLRTEIEYSETIPAPPAGRDPLEWFLFTWKEGYCNYSASAQVVMLRAVGIPARMVVGFAQGTRNENNDFVVLQKDAHAWPEVYFPEIGWVEFEPTLNQTRLIRPIGEIVTEEEPEGVLFGGLVEEEIVDPLLPEEEPEPTPTPENLEETSRKTSQLLPFWGMIVLLSVAILFGIWQLNRKQLLLKRGLQLAVHFYERRDASVPKWLVRWLAWHEASPIERAFHSINRSLDWLGVDTPAHLTPRERASALEELLPEQEEAIAALLKEHEESLFTPNGGDVEIAQRASSAIYWNTLKHKIRVHEREPRD